MDRSSAPGGDPPPNVPLGDAAIAASIARAATAGRGADRTPTLEQLLAAFGEPEATPAARRRVAAAMAMTELAIDPPIETAPSGARLTLRPPRGGRRGRPMAIVIALVALVALLAAAYAASSLLNGKDDESQQITLPPATLATATAPATTTSTGTTGTARTGTATTRTGTATTGSTATATTARTETGTTRTTATTGSRTTRSRSERRRASRREAAAQRRRRQAEAARRPMTVRVDARRAPTFLCVDDGAGHQLFNGTLSDRATFRRRHLRLNIGLASTRVSVNGREVTISGSPAGLDVSRSGGVRQLPLGQRPC